MEQTFDKVRTRGSLCRALVLVIPIIGLTGCIPEHVRDVEWCRNLESAKPLIDERGKANLTVAMANNKCAAKLLEAQKAAEQKASTPPPPAPKRTTKKQH